VMYKAVAGGYALWFLLVLAAAKIAACSMTLGIGGSGGIFAPSLFIGVTSGMAFGDVVHHIFGAGAGDPALYAVVAMGAVFASAARAPLTSLASVVEMTGDFALTLPVMLAIAIATALSRALSYGTIYTTKLLRRGTDIDRTTPWRALADLKIADAMRPFRPPLPVPPPAGGADGSKEPDWARLAGPVTYQADPQALFGTESVAGALRQLEAYGHDGLPVLSDDGRQIHGWVAAPDLLRTITRQIGTGQAQTGQAQTAQVQASADRDHAGRRSLPQRPPTPLPGYRLVEIVVAAGSPAAGRKLGEVSWPRDGTPVSVLRGRHLRPPHPHIALAPGDRVSLLTPAPGDSPRQDPAEPDDTRPSGNGTGSRA